MCYGTCLEPMVITYAVYRDGTMIADMLDMTTYMDDGLGYSETHCYTVTATDGTNVSEMSNEACATTYALEGCTDPTAINYDPEATEPCNGDNSCCEYDTLIDAPANLVTVGGNNLISLTWDAVEGSRSDVMLWVSNVTESNVEISMNSTADVYGFQFNISAEADLGASFGTASGGMSQDAGFVVSTNPSGLVLGFSFTGAFIPAGEGVLINVAWTHTGMDAFLDLDINNFAGVGGSALSTETGAHYCFGECVEPVVITYNVYREGTLIAADVDMTDYTDMGLGFSETHCYTVTASDGTNESDHSNESCATTFDAEDLIPPTNLTATGGDGFVDLQWSEPMAGGEQEMLYYEGPLSNAFYFYTTFEDGYAHGTKFDVGANFDLMAASVKILSAGDPYWPWPNSTHGPVRVIVLNDNGGMPGDVIYDEETVEDGGWATVYPNLTGLSGTFYVVVSHSVNWQTGGDAEGFGIDGSVDYPNNMVTLNAGVWSTGDPLGYGGDYMFSALINAYGTVSSMGYSDELPNYNQIDPTMVNSVHDGSLPAQNGPETYPDYHLYSQRDLLGYNVFRDGVQANTGIVVNTNYHDDGLVNELEYCYVVTAVYDAGESSPSNTACATPLGFIPSPPTNLTAEGGDTIVHLAWNTPDVEPGGFPPCPDGSAEYVDCVGVCFNNSDCASGGYDGCVEGENTWLGDGYCDDGTYGLDFNCEEYFFDNGDCDTGECSSLDEFAVSDYGCYTDSNGDSSNAFSITWNAGCTLTGFYYGVNDVGENFFDVTGQGYSSGITFYGFGPNEEYMFMVEVDALQSDIVTASTGPEDCAGGGDRMIGFTETDPYQIKIFNPSNTREELTGYNVYRSLSTGTPYDYLASTTVEMYDDPDVVNGTTYYYVVTAIYDDVTESDYSNEASATPQELIPYEPTDLTATAGDAFVDLAWIEPQGAEPGGFPPCPNGSAEYVDCVGTCFDNSDCADGTYDGCVEGENTWLGDGLCDDGAYGLDFNCEEYFFDYGDCDTGDCSSLDEFAVSDYGCYTDGSGASSNAFSITWNSGCTLTALYYGVNDIGENFFDVTGQGFSSGITFYGFGPNEEYMFMVEVDAIQSDIVTASTGPEDCAGGGDRTIGFTDTNSSQNKVFTPGTPRETRQVLENYNVYRSLTSGSGYSMIATTDAGTTEYTDTNVSNGITYYYVVTAVWEGGVESENSNEASATPMGTIMLSLSDGETLGGEEVMVQLSMTNGGEVGGIQIDLTDLPEHLTIAGLTGTARVPVDWAMSFSEQPDGSARILGFSFQNTVIAAGTGPIFGILFASETVLQPTDVALCTTNEVISDADGVGYGATSGCSTITLTVEGIDVTLSSVDEPVDQGGIAEIHLSVDNTDRPIYGFEIHLADMPESVTGIEVVGTDRIPEGVISFSDNNGELTVLWFSFTLTPIEPGIGELFTVTYQVNDNAPNGTTTISLEETLTVFSDEMGSSMFWASNTGTIDIGLPDVYLSLQQTSDNTFDLIMDNNTPVAGFQMDIQDIPNNYSFVSGVGTDRLPDGWTVTGSEFDGSFRLLGFSFNGSTIDAGSGAIMSVTMNVNAPMDSETDVCFLSYIISDTGGEPLFTMTDCSVFEYPYVTAGATQTLVLNPFMNNLISFYVVGDDMSANTVFGDGVLVATNDTGDFYVPSYGIDGIGTLENTEGYKVFVAGSDPLTLSISGVMMDPGTVYNWNPFMKNMFGYPYTESMSSTMAFGTVDDDILIISNDEGEFYVPSLGIATLNEVVAGKGYSVFINGTTTIGFTYPDMTTSVSRNFDYAAIEAYKAESQSQQYDVVKTGNPYAIILTALEGIVSAGDEVVAYANGELVGASRIVDLNMPVVISAWGAIEGFDADVAGFESGDQIELRVWSQTQNKELRVVTDLDNYQYGVAPLTTGSIVVVNEESVPTSFTLGQNYPNPFNPSTTINFTIPSEMQVQLAVYDITGRLVRTLINDQMVNTGYHSTVWDGKDAAGNSVSAGLYICSLKGEGIVQTQKMVMLK